jgi:hypothetical protein
MEDECIMVLKIRHISNSQPAELSLAYFHFSGSGGGYSFFENS